MTTEPRASLVEVEQADRERAADYISDHFYEEQDFAYRVRHGEVDSAALVVAFARHRLEALRTQGDGEGDEPATYEQMQAGYEQMRDLCKNAHDGWTAERRRLWEVEGCLRDLVSRLANTGYHNAIEMAAARKVLRHDGWTEAGRRWLDAAAPTQASSREEGE